MTALSGWLWPLAGRGLPASVAAGATPSRWAFESLLLIELPCHIPPVLRVVRSPLQISIRQKRISPPSPNEWARRPMPWP